MKAQLRMGDSGLVCHYSMSSDWSLWRCWWPSCAKGTRGASVAGFRRIRTRASPSMRPKCANASNVCVAITSQWFARAGVAATGGNNCTSKSAGRFVADPFFGTAQWTILIRRQAKRRNAVRDGGELVACHSPRAQLNSRRPAPGIRLLQGLRCVTKRGNDQIGAPSLAAFVDSVHCARAD